MDVPPWMFCCGLGTARDSVEQASVRVLLLSSEIEVAVGYDVVHTRGNISGM